MTKTDIPVTAEKPTLALAIHNLNSHGGHERSTLEIARRLRDRFSLVAYTYELEGEGGEGGAGIRVQRLRPEFAWDAFKIIYFLGASAWWFFLKPRITGERRPFILSTGTASLVSDVVQVQFVNKSWLEAKRAVDADVCDLPGARGRNPAVAALLRLYQAVLLRFNVAVEMAVYGGGKRFIAISESVRRELTQGFGARDVTVIRHGVDVRVFRPLEQADGEVRRGIRRDLGIDAGEIVVLFVGAFERKGLARAIDAFAAMPKELRTKARLLAVGSGEHEGYLARARNLGIEGSVVLAPNRADIAEVYRAADIFLMPTLYEPFGLVILEALASGLPSVVSALAGGAELIEDGVSGMLVRDPRDTLEISDILARLVDDEALRSRIGKAARKTAEARPWEVVAAEYAELLENFTNSPKGR